MGGHTRVYANDPDIAVVTPSRGSYSAKHDAQKFIPYRPLQAPLPPVVRFLDVVRQSVVLERPPQRLNIQYFRGRKQDALRSTVRTTYSISLPWQVYIARFSTYGGKMRPASLYPAFRPRPLSPDDDDLWNVHLPNVVSADYVCDSTQRPDVAGQDIVQGAMAYITNFWTSGFNDNAGKGANGRVWKEVLEWYERITPTEFCKLLETDEFFSKQYHTLQGRLNTQNSWRTKTGIQQLR